MSTFDKVIGYEGIKQELKQVCDMIHNPEVYKELGAELPKGIIMHGDPGLGKTLMAKCFIEESGLKSYVLRRTKGTEDFVKEISNTFMAAKENAPAIVFLDDMDKFANEDDDHTDAPEYVAIQACIDEVRDANVFVLATANRIRKLPTSLARAGRFDYVIAVRRPTGNDSKEIIKYFLKSKRISDEINMEDVAKMIQYRSCAELETIINEAAINAGFSRRDIISMKDLIQVVLRKEYESVNEDDELSEEELKKIALHEAGHLVVSEVLCPGSVGFASIGGKTGNSKDGVVRRCKELPYRTQHILISLGGKAAVELYHSEKCASGCLADIESAYINIRSAISESGSRGLGLIDIDNPHTPNTSESLLSRTEAVIQAELEHYMFQARNILLKNREFLEKTTKLLFEKKVLLFSDVQAIRNSVSIIEVAV